MGWKTDLLEASFRGVRFDVEAVRDNGEKSLAVHEYPYRAGAEVEDLGRKARTISITALFWGTDYLSGVADLVEALEQTGPGELIHPVFGSVKVAIRRWSIPHRADDPDYVAIEFEAVEAGLDNSFFDYKSARGTVEQTQTTLLSGVSGVIDEVSAAVGEKLAVVRDYAQTAQATMQTYLTDAISIYDTGADFVRSALSYVAYPSAFVSDLLAAQAYVISDAQSITNAFSRVAAMSGHLPSVGRTGITIKTTSRALGGTTGNYVGGTATGRAEAVLSLPRPQTADNSPSYPAPTPGAGTVEDMVVAAVTATQTAQLAQAVGEVLEDELDAPTMTPAEIEAIVGDVRERVQASLDWCRAACPSDRVHAVSEKLRAVADAVQTLGSTVLETRPAIVEHVVDAECNTHLLAHKLYGDYTRAAEIVRLNPQLRNPNFIAKGQILHVYAD